MLRISVCTLVVAIGLIAASDSQASLYGLDATTKLNTFEGPDFGGLPSTENVATSQNGATTLQSQIDFDSSGSSIDNNREFHVFSESSLNEGSIRLFASGVGGPAGDVPSNVLEARGVLFDEVTFFNDAGVESINVSVSLDGVYTVAGAPLQLAFTDLKLVVLPENTISDFASNIFIPFDEQPDAVVNEAVQLASSNDPLPIVLSGLVPLEEGQTSYQIGVFASILIFSNDASTVFEADFLSTASLSFDLPEDVAFTSASGVLLTGDGGTAVPAPAALPAGIVLLGVIGMRRKRLAA